MKLITFGCSWTKGVGIPYEKGMSKEEYLEVRSSRWDLMNKHSFRGILSERLNLENINYASGGSSNQRQERLATEYFNTHSHEDTVVLWGITSIIRNELPIDGELRNIMYSDNNSHARYYHEHFYDEKTELQRLSNMMIHWNKFFEAYHIPNLWFQTFNTYRFPQKIDRLLPRDLLSHLTRPCIGDLHYSKWDVDSKRIREAKEKGYVNPYSLHPTLQTHIILADFLEKPLREILIS
tara:strand:- start:138 stop:848 length:711 start_codon:yes stop_codon:yes gene_type:complete